DEDGDVGVGIFPEGEEVLIRRTCFGRIALHGVSTCQSEACQRAPWEVRHKAVVVDELLKLRCRSVAVVEHEIRFSTQINWTQEYRDVCWLAKFDHAPHLQ